MKRFFIFLCSICMILSLCFAVQASGTDAEQFYPQNQVLISETTETLSNGDSIILSVSEVPQTSRAAVYQRTGAKTFTYKSAAGEIAWQFTLNATYSVTAGINSKCIASSISHKIQDSNWNYVSGSTYYSASKAYGNGIFERTSLETQKCQITLACDANGNLS